MNDLTIAIVQPELRWEDPPANRERLEQLIRSVQGSPDLVVIPEMFTTGFSMRPEPLAETMEGPTLAWMRRLAAELQITLTGSLIVKEGGAFYNRLIWMPPDGNFGAYDKRHLFRIAGEQEQYSQGKERFIARLRGWRVNLNICYDLRFPVWSRQSPDPDRAGPEYDLLVYVANWPESRSLAWKTLLPARAVENQCYALGVNRVGPDGNGIPHSGDSMIVDPFGKILFTASEGEAVHTRILEWAPMEDYRHRYPFWRDADSFRIV